VDKRTRSNERIRTVKSVGNQNHTYPSIVNTLLLNTLLPNTLLPDAGQSGVPR